MPGFDFVIEHWCFQNGWTTDARCFARIGVAEALVKAHRQLPKGYNFKVFDGWRSREVQKAASEATKRNLLKTHPRWSDRRTADVLRALCPPPQGILMDMGTHRFGGSLDLTVVDANGRELVMTLNDRDTAGEGTSVPNDSPQNSLLYFDRIARPNRSERRARENRHLMINALESALFTCLMVEWWHWDFREDLEPLIVR